MSNSSAVLDLSMKLMHFSWYDYGLFVFMLSSSVVIGIYFGCFGKKQKTAEEYLLGGKEMQILPIAISLVASNVSGITVLSIPADIYQFGSNYALVFIAMPINCIAAAYITLPVFHKLQITSTYEYLKLRFDTRIRLMASFLYNISMLLYLPIVIYGPALALSQVTPINLHLVNPILCAICIFYTTIGGLKTVVWTDNLQFGAMVISMFAVLYLGVVAVGGMGTIFSRSYDGERLQIDFDPDPTKRDTFWALIIGWTINWMPHICIGQSAVQKCLSLPTLQHIKKAVLLFAIGSILCKVVSVFTGLMIYATYHDCDPFTMHRIEKNDQLLPYYVMDVAGKIPGLPGLFIAGVFCAGLSTLSAHMNALSGTIYEDFIRRFVSKNITDVQISNILKIIVIVIGVLSTVFVFVVERLGGILELSIAFSGITAGPLAGLFLLGMLFPLANSKGAFYGSITSMIFVSIMMIGNRWYQASGALKYLPKPTSIDGCIGNVTAFATNTTVTTNGEDIFVLFRISHYYYAMLGAVIVLAVALPISWMTEKQKVVDEELITPWMQWAIPKSAALSHPPEYELVAGDEIKNLKVDCC